MSTSRQLVDELRSSYQTPTGTDKVLEIFENVYTFLNHSIVHEHWEDLLSFVNGMDAVFTEVMSISEVRGIIPESYIAYFKGAIDILYGFSKLALGDLYIRTLSSVDLDNITFDVLKSMPSDKKKHITLAMLKDRITSADDSGVRDILTIILLLSKMNLISLYISKGIQKVKLGKQAPSYLAAKNKKS